MATIFNLGKKIMEHQRRGKIVTRFTFYPKRVTILPSIGLKFFLFL